MVPTTEIADRRQNLSLNAEVERTRFGNCAERVRNETMPPHMAANYSYSQSVWMHVAHVTGQQNILARSTD